MKETLHDEQICNLSYLNKYDDDDDDDDDDGNWNVKMDVA